MKKIFLFAFFIPLLGMGQAKNVINNFRIFAKPEKSAELRKALASHAQKYHSGDWKWRVYLVESGPDAGAYHVVEGPNSWATFDSRGDLGPEHTADFDKNVLPLSTGAGSQSYVVYNEELSNIALTDFTDKIIISHVFPKPGMVVGTQSLIKKLKKVWAAGNETVAVYTAIASGPPQFTMVSRLKAGLKELDSSYRKPLPERYNEVYGEGAWDYYLSDYAKYVESRWSELLIYQPELSSK